MSTTVRWLGSPQTAITATMHNFLQLRRTGRLSPKNTNRKQLAVWNNALYVLACFNQFETIDPDDERHQAFVAPLLYGLFRPTVNQSYDDHPDVRILEQLLSALAFQLRMLRRRAVIPTLASLGVYIVAFAISVTILFIEVEQGSVVAPLVLGLLFSWLPVLVTLTIVDRNPISSERTG
jgi:hypothetical protein